MASFKVLETQFQMFIKSKIYLNDEYIVMTRNYFLEYTRLDIPEFRDTLIQNMDYVKKSIEKRALHKMEYDSRVNERLMQTTEEKVDSSKELDARLMQTTEEKVDSSKELDASLVIIESNGTESQEQDTSSRSGNDAHVDDADIRPIYNEEPMVEVQMTVDDNVSATSQQHTKLNPIIKGEIPTEHRFSIKRTSTVHEKTTSPRSCLRWQPTGRILKTVCFRWVPTGKIFTSSTTKVDSEPPNVLKEDITNQCESEQALDVSVGLVPQGQKASDYDNSDPVPPKQNVVPTAEKTNSSHQGLEFLFSPLIEEYYTPTHGQAEENNNDQAPNASFQEVNLSILFVHGHNYRWTKDHPLEQVRGNPTMPVQTRRQLATDPEMCMFALIVSIVEPKNIKEAMADSAWIKAMQDELHQFHRLKVWELVNKPFAKMIIKLKWLWKMLGFMF
ncbi:hypothetical protein Tco_1023107 [Tanacetum coccineum]